MLFEKTKDYIHSHKLSLNLALSHIPCEINKTLFQDIRWDIWAPSVCILISIVNRCTCFLPLLVTAF